MDGGLGGWMDECVMEMEKRKRCQSFRPELPIKLQLSHIIFLPLQKTESLN